MLLILAFWFCPINYAASVSCSKVFVSILDVEIMYMYILVHVQDYICMYMRCVYNRTALGPYMYYESELLSSSVHDTDDRTRLSPRQVGYTFYTVFEQLNFAFIADCLLNNSINFASAAAVKINNITWEKNCVLTMNYIYMYRER